MAKDLQGALFGFEFSGVINGEPMRVQKLRSEDMQVYYAARLEWMAWFAVAILVFFSPLSVTVYIHM